MAGKRAHGLAAAGFTLIELVIAVVVLAALGAGIAVVFVTGPAASADPQVRAQARAIAESYMEEILLKAYEDPDPSVAETGGAETGETRSGYDDVWDYCAIGGDSDCSQGTEDPTDQNGTASAGGALDAYAVTVIIEGTVGSTPATVRVRVSHTSGLVDYQLVSQRADY